MSVDTFLVQRNKKLKLKKSFVTVKILKQNPNCNLNLF